ncbi:MAG: hypothetical protein K2Q26_03260 [Bdellovibrionales bacterium]|nr:hypothetical protein [Bdellovibrionales bacterium]
MKALSIFTALFVTVGAFASNSSESNIPTQPPISIEQKTLIYCDYVESEAFALFMDMYVYNDEITGAYTLPEFGVFQGDEQTGYPDYVWNHTEEKVEITQQQMVSYTYNYFLSKDHQTLAFTLPGTADGLTLTKVDNKIQDFELAVKGLVGQDKTIDATFTCYDPTTKISEEENR